MLLTKEVEIKTSRKNSKYYLNLGYDIPTYVNKRGKISLVEGSTITVKIEDLQRGSRTKIKVKCDYCGKIYELEYSKYINRKRDLVDKDACKDCRKKKSDEAIQVKYGTNNLAHVESIVEKRKKTNLQKYGCENPMENKDVRNKAIQTTIDHYGVACCLHLPEIKEKCLETMKKKYGVEYTAQSPELRKKMSNTMSERYGVRFGRQVPGSNEKYKKTCLERYGHENSMSSDEILSKQQKTLYKNGTQKCSNQQRYLHNLYGGELNFPFKRYSLDIFIPDDNIDIEYDGSGHRLSVAFGNITEEEFNRRAIIRTSYTRNEGIRTFTIVSKFDYLPVDEILLKMYKESLSYFNSTGHSWRTYYIDNGTFKDAEHPNGEPYDFGELRKIKKSA